jgi:hypothetical protein
MQRFLAYVNNRDLWTRQNLPSVALKKKLAQSLIADSPHAVLVKCVETKQYGKNEFEELQRERNVNRIRVF